MIVINCRQFENFKANKRRGRGRGKKVGNHCYMSLQSKCYFNIYIYQKMHHKRSDYNYTRTENNLIKINK